MHPFQRIRKLKDTTSLQRRNEELEDEISLWKQKVKKINQKELNLNAQKEFNLAAAMKKIKSPDKLPNMNYTLTSGKTTMLYGARET